MFISKLENRYAPGWKFARNLAQAAYSFLARHGHRPGWSGTKAGAQARPGDGPRAVSGANRLEPVEKVVTQSVAWGLSGLDWGQ